MARGVRGWGGAHDRWRENYRARTGAAACSVTRSTPTRWGVQSGTRLFGNSASAKRWFFLLERIIRRESEEGKHSKNKSAVSADFYRDMCCMQMSLLPILGTFRFYLYSRVPPFATVDREPKEAAQNRSAIIYSESFDPRLRLYSDL